VELVVVDKWVLVVVHQSEFDIVVVVVVVFAVLVLVHNFVVVEN
jgi:hypothetical protein